MDSTDSDSIVTLKRPYAISIPGGTQRSTSTPRPPQLPKITGELILQVFTHKSLRRKTGHPSDYEDNERLIELGTKVLDTAITFCLFSQTPLLTVRELSIQRARLLQSENIYNWASMYRLQEKLRRHPDMTLDRSMEGKDIFCAYIAGVYTEHGIDVVQDWVNQLTRTDWPSQPNLVPVIAAEDPPPKKVKSEPLSPSVASGSKIFFASQPPPSPAPRLPGPPPGSRYAPPSAARYISQQPATAPQAPFQRPRPLAQRPLPHLNPLAPAQPTLPFLPLFNQTASQRRVAVEYPAEQSGPPHAPRWTVRCVVNGIEKGVGVGNSKQVAKEEAARQAFYAMGWT
ncbi:ribonuclease III domain-containing protein [Infundibulicybe gibba]|nr:ribonuclease III domain-containing protein [Infundibulicybe gibba]